MGALAPPNGLFQSPMSGLPVEADAPRQSPGGVLRWPPALQKRPDAVLPAPFGARVQVKVTDSRVRGKSGMADPPTSP